MTWSGRTFLGLLGIVMAGRGLFTARLDAGAQPLASAAAVRQRSESPAPSADTTPQTALVKRYCVTCHNERLKTGGLTLDGVDVRQPGEHAEVWEKVVRKIRSGAMPPSSAPRPDRDSINSFVSWIEDELDRDRARKPQPGRPAIHRLNRAEYTNAIRDLLAVEIDAARCCRATMSSYGFDNIADVLTISPTLLERYLSAARKISRLAVGEQTAKPVVQIYTLPRTLVQLDRMSDDLPFRIARRRG